MMDDLGAPLTPRRISLPRMSDSTRSLLYDTDISPYISQQNSHTTNSIRESFELASYQDESLGELSNPAESQDGNGRLEVVNSNTSNKPHDGKSTLLASWVPEILCLCAAVLSLIATLLLLVEFNGREQPEWPYASTLNLGALLALLATVTRSMLGQVLESGAYMDSSGETGNTQRYLLYVIFDALADSAPHLSSPGPTQMEMVSVFSAPAASCKNLRRSQSWHVGIRSVYFSVVRSVSMRDKLPVCNPEFMWSRSLPWLDVILTQ